MAEQRENTAQRANQALYEKMRAAQDMYRNWLLKQPPEELLNHAYEYVVREDILLSAEYNDLSGPQARALLKSPDPVSSIFRDFEKLETGYMDTIAATIAERADRELRKIREARTGKDER